MPTASMTATEKTLLLRHAELVADVAANNWGRSRIGRPEFHAGGLHGDWSVVVEGIRDDVVMDRTRVWIDSTEDRLGGDASPQGPDDETRERRVRERSRMTTFVAHLADDANPLTTLCGLPWQDWQHPDQGAPLEDAVAAYPTQREKAEIREADRRNRPQQGDRVEQCQACAKAARR